MIVSYDSVNATALPYVWQLIDNYGYTHYYLQTNPALHEAKDEAEARYYEAETEAKKFGLEAVLT